MAMPLHDQRGQVRERHQRVQQRPLPMQLAQRVHRNLAGEIAFELLRMLGVVRKASCDYPEANRTRSVIPLPCPIGR